MAGAGNAILFIAALVGLTMFTMLYLIFACHYFLTTISDSSAGLDEVHFPRESLTEWWWKPILCLWVLGVWLVPALVILAPIGLASPRAYFISLIALLWFLYPLSLLSAMYTQNWLFFLHPVILWRMLRHYGAFAYVHFITLLAAVVCVGFVVAALTQSLIWAIPAVVAIPTAILFYARHWGRFAWLSLNFLPRKNKPRQAAATSTGKADAATESVPEMDVQEFDPASELLREGLPPNHPGSYRAGVPVPAEGVIAGAPNAPFQVEHDWSMNNQPMALADDADAPMLQPMPSPAAAQSTAADGEEDEWSTEKKPYDLIGDADFKAAPPSPTDNEPKAEADRPISVTKHFDDRHEREQEAKRKAREANSLFGMPAPQKDAPSFADALFFGVWNFMVYERTLTVWVNLILLTAVEMFFLWLAASLLPPV
jgi:hypothetical protein